MTSIIGKRASLHKNIVDQQQQNDTLKSQVVQLQALANIGISTCMIIHEINNLLTPLASYCTLALKNPNDKSLTEKALQKTAQACQRASKIVESMLAVANGQSQEKQDVSLNLLVEEIFSCLCRDFAKDGITVRTQIPEDLTIWAVPVQIQQVLMNLILNARDAMLPHGGVLTIQAQEVTDAVEIEISDTGSGIGPSDLGKIFEPFFTTKAANTLSSRRSGSGLGLTFCKKIIDAHGGTIFVESQLGKGTTFKITLPKLPEGNNN